MFAQSFAAVRDVPISQLRRTMPGLLTQLEKLGCRLCEKPETFKGMDKHKPGPMGSKSFEVKLLNGEGEQRIESVDAPTLRAAALAGEIASGCRAVSVTLLGVASPIEIAILGRCSNASCRDFVLITERSQRIGDALLCEDCRR